MGGRPVLQMKIKEKGKENKDTSVSTIKYF